MGIRIFLVYVPGTHVLQSSYYHETDRNVEGSRVLLA